MSTLSSINQVLEEGGRTAAEKLRLFFGLLEEEFSVAINLHDLEGISQINPEVRGVLEPFLYHNNAFCNHVKKNAGFLASCSLAKTILCRTFRQKDNPFFGGCYLGIEELRYPIRWNGRLLGFLCVGQFCTDREAADARIEHYAAKEGADPVRLKALHRQVVRPLDFDIRRFGLQIGFLADYLALLYAQTSSARSQGIDVPFDALEHTRNYLVTRTKAFIQDNYASALPLKVLAANAYCSQTYLSALFRKVEGRTLTEAILEVRLSKAKTLLDTTTLSITETAFATGFNDSNYFSRAFRKHFGQSPRHYRSG